MLLYGFYKLKQRKTMTTLEQMYEKAQQFAEEVEVSILNDDFKLISCDAYTCTIEVHETKLDIWISKEPDNTRIYQIHTAKHRDGDYPKHHFKAPHMVRNALLSYSINSMEHTEEEHY